MPIRSIEKQLAERGILGNFTRVGKLRKGGEKSEKNAGRDLDYFRVTFEPQHEYLRQPFVEMYGDKPTEFRNVFLAANSADQAFQYFYEQWAHARLLKRCDGEDIQVQWLPGESRYDQEPANCTCNPAKRACGLHGRLDVVLPEFNAATGAMAKFTVETHSIYDVVALRSCMIVAGALANNLPNTAFWSIPFRFGRTARTVPVTINGQRSLKPMSLLYIEIEPEFNQVVISPRLTAPTQKLLAGVNPETGEMPAVEFEQPQAWDREYVNEQTLHLFEHENHQMHSINQLIAHGVIHDDMDDSEVIELITEHRAIRDDQKAAQNASKSSEKGSTRNAGAKTAQSPNRSEMAHKLIEAAAKWELSVDDILAALRRVSPTELVTLDDYRGDSAEAWAACVAYKAGYSLSTLAEMIPDPANMVRVRTEQIIMSAQPF